jgi:hypothetical protein
VKTTASVAVLVMAVGITGCSLFRLERPPDEVDQMLRDMSGPGMGCTPIVREADRMARAELPSGGVAELWVAPTNEGGTMEAIIEKVADDNVGGASFGGGCGAGAAGDGITWSGGMATFDDQADSGWVLLSGRAMPAAESVLVTFANEEPIAIEIQVDGYFMHALPISSTDEMETRSWPDTVDALDGDGAVIATLDLGG